MSPERSDMIHINSLMNYIKFSPECGRIMKHDGFRSSSGRLEPSEQLSRAPGITPASSVAAFLPSFQ